MEQEQDLKQDPAPEPDRLKVAIMATVLNGTLEDHQFLDDDDDSFEDEPMGDTVCDMVSNPIPSTVVVSSHSIENADVTRQCVDKCTGAG